MQVDPNAVLAFSEKVPSDNRVLNPLGLSHHLVFQNQFVPGITSVTKRARYYTLQALYYENLYEEEVITLKDFERLFILACLAHHDGDSSHPSLRHVHNKTRFDDTWSNRNQFDLDFEITGNGQSYYISQLETLRCAWTDSLGQEHYTLINQKLANSINLEPDIFATKEFTKDQLKRDFSDLCICNKNEQEIEILSKLFFGFFLKTERGWDLDNPEYDRFKDGDVELQFSDDLIVEDRDQEEKTKQENLRRRSTLFLFLKIVDQTQPRNISRTIWDAVYFSQNRQTKGTIKFNQLEHARKFWEFFQLNIYYVYTLESLLEVLQDLVRNNHGITEDDLLARFGESVIKEEINEILEKDVETVEDLLSGIEAMNGSKRTDLTDPINESGLYDRIADAGSWEEKAAACFMMLQTLKFRYELTSDQIRNQVGDTNNTKPIRDDLDIHMFFADLESSKGDTVIGWLQALVMKVKRRHLFEAASRLSSNDTRAWLFTEEDGQLFYAHRRPFSANTRDNRWDSIESLLKDLAFVKGDGDNLVLTKKGEQWLQRIE